MIPVTFTLQAAQVGQLDSMQTSYPQDKSAEEEHIRKYCCPGKIKITSTYAPIIRLS